MRIDPAKSVAAAEACLTCLRVMRLQLRQGSDDRSPRRCFSMTAVGVFDGRTVEQIFGFAE